MKATKQKIDWALRAINEMRASQQNAARDDFQYHFGAFLALPGALRQFITVDPHKKWVYSMDEKDPHYCACVDLRNVDVHVANVVQSPRSAFDVQIRETIGPVTDFAIAITKTGSTPSAPVSNQPPPPRPPKASDSEGTSVTANFFVNPDTLPPEFAVLQHSGQARSIKAQEESLLRGTPAVDVAQKALDLFVSTVLPQAQRNGVPIP